MQARPLFRFVSISRMEAPPANVMVVSSAYIRAWPESKQFGKSLIYILYIVTVLVSSPGALHMSILESQIYSLQHCTFVICFGYTTETICVLSHVYHSGTIFQEEWNGRQCQRLWQGRGRQLSLRSPYRYLRSSQAGRQVGPLLLNDSGGNQIDIWIISCSQIDTHTVGEKLTFQKFLQQLVRPKWVCSCTGCFFHPFYKLVTLVLISTHPGKYRRL